MKLHKIALALAMVAALTACEKETTSQDATNLPAKAQDLISQNFSSGISLVKTETNTFGKKEYDVILTDGSSISFNSSGEWEEIETPNNLAVPEGLVPTAIANYVRAKHAGTSIVGIDIEKKGFEVNLSNGVKIDFDKAGNFIKYDN